MFIEMNTKGLLREALVKRKGCRFRSKVSNGRSEGFIKHGRGVTTINGSAGQREGHKGEAQSSLR